MMVVDTTLRSALKDFEQVTSLTLSRGNRSDKEYPTVMDDFIAGFYPKKNPRIRIIFEDGKPVAWGWTSGYYLYRNFIKNPQRALAFMVYVDPKYRRKGLGTELYRWAKSVAKDQHRKLYVFPHDAKSTCFFSELGAKNKRRHY